MEGNSAFRSNSVVGGNSTGRFEDVQQVHNFKQEKLKLIKWPSSPFSFTTPLHPINERKLNIHPKYFFLKVRESY
jgi:hypothetical protein